MGTGSFATRYNFLIVLSMFLMMSVFMPAPTSAQEDLEPSLILHHEDRVRGAGWNSDDTRILSWSIDDTARVWNAITGEELLTMIPAKPAILWASWNSDDIRILTISPPATVQVWDAETGALIAALDHGQDNGLVWGSLNRDGSRVLSWSSAHRTSYVWDVESSTELLTLDKATHPAWNENETRIAAPLCCWVTDTHQYGIGVWDAETGGKTSILEYDQSPSSVRWLDETRISFQTRDSLTHVWDVESAQEPQVLPSLDSTRWDRDGRRLLTWSEDGKTEVLDATTGEALVLYPGSGEENPPINSMGARWNPDETRILSWAPGDNRVRIWDAQTGEELLTLPELDTYLWDATWSPTGDYIATMTSETSDAYVWDAESGEALYTLSLDGEIHQVRWSNTGNRILAWGQDNALRVWDISE